MSVMFECEYRGERFTGFGRPAPGGSLDLHRVTDGQVHAALVRAAGPVGLITALVDTPTVTVTADAPELRFLPPMLPVAGAALVSGFMRTHSAKWIDATPQDVAVNPYAQWFFKGLGSWLRLPGDTMTVPASSTALIEEAEVVLVYVNDADGTPHYAGYTFGNDLCDIGLHRLNPAYNAYCKLCDTSITPWLFLEEPPESVTGRVFIERCGAPAWEGTFSCGADTLHFPVKDMADHLLSYPALRRPGMVNYVFLGADLASFHQGFRIEHGDRVAIDVTSHDVQLANVVEWEGRAAVA